VEVLMGYYMRFYDTDPRPLYISELRNALREIDPEFEIENGSDALNSGYLTYGGALHAEVDISGPETEYFGYDWRSDSLTALDAQGDAVGMQKVAKVLRDAQRMVYARVRWGGRDAETTLSRLDLLWDWLFVHRSGLLYAEGEGFYEDETLILAIK
jgi:hypothetical protein